MAEATLLHFKPLTGNIIEREATVLGLAPAAGLYKKEVSEADAVALIHAAARRNITKLDTAPLYGCGRSEIDIGRAFAREPELMSSVEIATKVGRLCLPEASDKVKALDASADEKWRVEHDDTYYSRERDTGHLVCVADYSGPAIVASLEESKARLGGGPAAAAVVTLRIHDAEAEERFDDLTRGTAIEELKKLREDGTIKAFGLGMNNPAFVLRLLQRYPKTFDSILLAGCWNLMDQSGRAVLEECEQQGVDVHIAGVFGAGLLWGSNKYRYGDAKGEHFARRDRLEALAAAHGVPLPWLAAHFATRPRCVTQLVIGARRAPELEQTLDLLQLVVDEAAVEALYAAMAAEGLIAERDYKNLVA